MNKIISSACGALLLAGCACGRYECTPVADAPAYYYRRPLPRLRPLSPEPCEITRTQEAAVMRQNALRRTLATEACESQIYTSSHAQPSGTGVSTFLPPRYGAPPGSVTGAPRVSPGFIPPGPPLGPSPVAEESTAPVAVPVRGKPGFVISPYSPNAGYVDVSGMAPGSEARDPYTGKVFRVP